MKNLQVLRNKENNLLGFNEVELQADFEATAPSKHNAVKIVCDEFGVDKNLCAIRKISGSFGVQSFRIYARIYKDREIMNNLEGMTKKKKKSKRN